MNDALKQKILWVCLLGTVTWSALNGLAAGYHPNRVRAFLDIEASEARPAQVFRATLPTGGLHQECP